jgi:hypothetical protein
MIAVAHRCAAMESKRIFSGRYLLAAPSIRFNCVLMFFLSSFAATAMGLDFNLGALTKETKFSICRACEPILLG